MSAAPRVDIAAAVALGYHVPSCRPHFSTRCGVAQPAATAGAESEKRILPAFLLCFFFGVFGVHRFYAAKIGTGVLELVTIGSFGIWWLVDLILIATGSFTDGDGSKITAWT
ncbi:MAG TPA: TM2 domain-containing protein [Gemmatimonadaceae bacterium]